MNAGTLPVSAGRRCDVQLHRAGEVSSGLPLNGGIMRTLGTASFVSCETDLGLWPGTPNLTALGTVNRVRGLLFQLPRILYFEKMRRDAYPSYLGYQVLTARLIPHVY